MKKIATAALVAAVATVASWAVRQWLERRPRDVRTRRRPIETWENEGGALAPHQVTLETSQVPR